MALWKVGGDRTTAADAHDLELLTARVESTQLSAIILLTTLSETYLTIFSTEVKKAYTKAWVVMKVDEILANLLRVNRVCL